MGVPEEAVLIMLRWRWNVRMVSYRLSQITNFVTAYADGFSGHLAVSFGNRDLFFNTRS